MRNLEGQLALLHGNDVSEIPGSRLLLECLVHLGSPWAIVTSGTEMLVNRWLGALSLAKPEHIISAESVEDGKPDPACYMLGLKRLGLQDVADDVLVLEDAPAGIAAGKAAGCKVVGLLTSHSRDEILAARPDWIVKDLESIKVVGQNGGILDVEIFNDV